MPQPQIQAKLLGRLGELYGSSRGEQTAEQLGQLFDLYAAQIESREADRADRWRECDIVLITYADQIYRGDQPTLRVLGDFLAAHGLGRLVRIIHLLPFYPYSSDDGFSVIDYRAVLPVAGGWKDVHELARKHDLMFDLVLNHCSRQSRWFQAFLAGELPYDGYFMEVDPDADVSQVTRPRSWPLLTPFETNRGTRYVWTTFSDDQVDLNFANPDVLVEMISILLFYIAEGARIVRLDAIAYLWKELGTTCIHHPKTHIVVQLMRDVVEIMAPHVILLTETNVPHAENVSYFGDGNEAHMVYQFSLPPLLLDAIRQQDAAYFVKWLRDLRPPAPNTTYFNFTASHDGIGVRPLEGLVPQARFDQLVQATCQRGGRVNTRRTSDGSDIPYELNITYLAAIGEEGLTSTEHAERFLTSQAIMLSLQGIPGVYFHSLVGSPNDEQAVEASGIARRINRHKYQWEELMSLLDDRDSLQGQVYRGYQRLLATRVEQPAFHPDASQCILECADPQMVGFLRSATDRSQQIVVLANLSEQSKTVAVRDLRLDASRRIIRELVHDEIATDADHVTIPPFRTMWLELH